MTDYVIREDGKPQLFSSTDDEDINPLDILKNYPYILKSMKSENYRIDRNSVSVFDELIYDNKVVGFVILELLNMEVILLTDCYILPEFRGKGLFYEEIRKLHFISPDFGILQPTRKLVELLIDYNFAQKVENNIVVSAIKFYFDNSQAISNKRDEIQEEIPPSNYYDIEISSIIQVFDGEVIYHRQLKDDLLNYDVRKKLNKHYFKNIKKTLKNNKKQYKQLIEDLTDNLPKELLTYEDIIGDGEELSDFFIRVVENEIVSYKRALEIKQQLIDEYESGEIDDKTIEDRTTSILLEEMENQDSFKLTEDDDIFIEGFDEIIGDNEELRKGIYDAIISDDKEKFMELLQNEMDNDEEFNDKLLQFVDKQENPNHSNFTNFEQDVIDQLNLNFDSPYPIADMMWGSGEGKYKLDNTFYGKDYPISYDNYIYNALKTIKNGGSLKTALMQKDMDGSMTSQMVEKVLFDWELVSGEVNYDNWSEFANKSLKVDDLKDILRKNNLKVSGKKQELIDRIEENQVPLDDFKAENVTLTENGEEFLEEYKWIDVYDEALSKFYFNDYCKYLDEHEGDFKEVTLKYIDDHLKLARKERNKKYLNDCNKAKKIVSAFDDFD